MKKTFLLSFVALYIVAGLVAGAEASTISVSNVGSVDTLLAETILSNSGDQTEIDWVESITGLNITLDFKKDAGASDWMTVDGSGVAQGTFAYQFTKEPEYFLIKTGNNDSHYRDFLFKNVAGFDYAVINLGVMGFGLKDIANIGKISHIDGLNDPPTTVPEPTTMLLFGTGLVGLVGARLRKKKK
jgi:hypothetical protein